VTDPTRELLIIDAGDGTPLGQIVLSSISPVHRNCEFSIRIGREADRGRGVGSTAIRLMLNHAWNDLGLHRVSLTVHESNIRARRAYEKCGFAQEGMLRDAAFVDGNWVNLIVMSVLSSDPR
jgi:RimJ/RimL family protein N-acetyltransferase